MTSFITVNEALVASDGDFAAMTDDNIKKLAYGIEYFAFSPYNAKPFDKPTPEMRQRLADLRQRLATLEEQTRPAVRGAVATTLCDCGHYSAHPMTTSMGTSCADCYDRMSD